MRDDLDNARRDSGSAALSWMGERRTRWAGGRAAGTSHAPRARTPLSLEASLRRDFSRGARMQAASSDDRLRWVCAKAAANNSVSQCDKCEWFALHDLAPNETVVNVNLQAAECAAVQPKLAWFMCLTPASDKIALGHLDYAKAAIISARLNAPSITPYVVLVRHKHGHNHHAHHDTDTIDATH